MNKECITITFGERVENHVGMQMIGTLADRGLTVAQLKKTKGYFEENNIECQLIRLNDALPDDLITESEEAAILVIRSGLDFILQDMGKNSTDMYNEQAALDWDTRVKMYGRVVNKTARHNLCYDNVSAEPDYSAGKGRVISFETVPCTNAVRLLFNQLFSSNNLDLKAEGNRYYDARKCGIGFHGDSERKVVIAVRLGCTMSLHYRWFRKSTNVGERVKLKLNNGDIYIMSEKATGNDWKKRNILTLRHAAGSPKYVTCQDKKEN